MEFRLLPHTGYGVKFPKKSFDGKLHYYSLENVRSVELDEDYLLNNVKTPTIVIEHGDNRTFRFNDCMPSTLRTVLALIVQGKDIPYHILQKTYISDIDAEEIFRANKTPKGLDHVIHCYQTIELECISKEYVEFFKKYKFLSLTRLEYLELVSALSQCCTKPRICAPYKITHNQYYKYALSEFLMDLQ